MSDIGPGTMLVCVTEDTLDMLTVGAVYVCADLTKPGRCPTCGIRSGIRLADGPNPTGAKQAWCSCLFAPVGRKGQFDHRLAGEPVDNRVSA